MYRSPLAAKCREARTIHSTFALSSSPKPLSITSQSNPMTVISIKVNVLNAPLAGELTVVVTKSDGVGIGAQYFVTLCESVVTHYSANACPRVGKTEFSKNIKESSFLIRREPFVKAPLCDCASPVRLPGAEQSSLLNGSACGHFFGRFATSSKSASIPIISCTCPAPASSHRGST